MVALGLAGLSVCAREHTHKDTSRSRHCKLWGYISYTQELLLTHPEEPTQRARSMSSSLAFR